MSSFFGTVVPKMYFLKKLCVNRINKGLRLGDSFHIFNSSLCRFISNVFCMTTKSLIINHLDKLNHIFMNVQLFENHIFMNVQLFENYIFMNVQLFENHIFMNVQSFENHIFMNVQLFKNHIFMNVQ